MFNRNRDDLPTLRITSLSTDADEDDLRDMFGRYGRIARANVVRDRETGESKGFAFVSFESRADGEKAMKALDGRGQSQAVAENSARGSLIDIFDLFTRIRQPYLVCQLVIAPRTSSTVEDWRLGHLYRLLITCVRLCRGWG